MAVNYLGMSPHKQIKSQKIPFKADFFTNQLKDLFKLLVIKRHFIFGIFGIFDYNYIVNDSVTFGYHSDNIVQSDE